MERFLIFIYYHNVFDNRQFEAITSVSINVYLLTLGTSRYILNILSNMHNDTCDSGLSRQHLITVDGYNI